MGQDQLLHLIRAMEKNIDQAVSDADYRSVALPCKPFPGDRVIDSEVEPDSDSQPVDLLADKQYSETRIYLHLSKAV